MEDIILVTGANGFIGSRVVRRLLSRGLKRIRCFTRSMNNSELLEAALKEFGREHVEFVRGNLLSRDDCLNAARGVSVVYHLAAGVEKTYPGCFLNSVVTTRNLLDAVMTQKTLKRFVNISSFAVYSNRKIRRGGLMDESCDLDADLVDSDDPYAYGKAKQDELVLEYGREKGLPFVIVRPGVVFGPGKAQIFGRVGIGTFGVFMHIGMNNRIPLTYVDNCAEAIVLAGVKEDIESEVINVIDDDLPKSREYLALYKKHVRKFLSVPMPYRAFYVFCYLWERYSKWSEGQLPPKFNRMMCDKYWRGNRYSNDKARRLLGWHPSVPMQEGLRRYFAHAREVIPR